MTIDRSPRLCLWAVVCGCLLFGLSVVRAIGESAGQEPVAWSESARLASRSLLLDVAEVGDRVLVVGDRAHVLLSEDKGTTWAQVLVPTRSMLTAVATSGEDLVWVVGHDTTIIHSADGGRNWTLQFYAPEDEAPLLDVWFENERHGLAVGAYGLALETVDGGVSWERKTIDEEEPHLNAITEGRDGTLYIAGEFGLVFRSRDQGRTWERLETSYGGSFFGALVLSTGEVLVFGLRGNVYRSVDGGDSWGRVETYATASMMGGVQRADGTVLLVGLAGTLLVGSEGGERFTAVNRVDRNGIAAVTELGPKRLLLIGEAGVCRIGVSLTESCAHEGVPGGS